MIVVPGIITAATKTHIKASKVIVKCSNCGHEKELKSNPGFGSFVIPRVCDNQKNPGLDKQNCKMDTYRVMTDKCEVFDQQILKLQEAPELIPTGEMPRSFSLTCDKELTDKVTPGNRVKIVGILSITSGKSNNINSNKQV